MPSSLHLHVTCCTSLAQLVSTKKKEMGELSPAVLDALYKPTWSCSPLSDAMQLGLPRQVQVVLARCAAARHPRSEARNAVTLPKWTKRGATVKYAARVVEDGRRKTRNSDRACKKKFLRDDGSERERNRSSVLAGNTPTTKMPPPAARRTAPRNSGDVVKTAANTTYDRRAGAVWPPGGGGAGHHRRGARSARWSSNVRDDLITVVEQSERDKGRSSEKVRTN